MTFSFNTRYVHSFYYKHQKYISVCACVCVCVLRFNDKYISSSRVQYVSNYIGECKTFLYNQPKPYFFKIFLWSHFAIDFNKFYTTTFRIVHILIVYFTGARGTVLPPPFIKLSVCTFIFNTFSLFLYYFISFSLF